MQDEMLYLLMLQAQQTIILVRFIFKITRVNSFDFAFLLYKNLIIYFQKIRDSIIV